MLSSNTSAVSGDANYIEDVFSTYLYTGNGSTQTITNGIDLAGEGGLVWCKNRTSVQSHELADTARGYDKSLRSNTTDAQFTGDFGGFNSNGFSLIYANSGNTNESGKAYASWTFRKQAKFFDVVTYTGDGTGGARLIPHNLKSLPGFIVVKPTSTTGNWRSWHRGAGGVVGLELNSTAVALATGSGAYHTDTDVYIGSVTDAVGNGCNTTGVTYVMYLFAHNAGGFGLTGTDNVISCGSYTGNGSTGQTINLGWEPQWVLSKKASGTSNWVLFDTMRGYNVSVGDMWLEANSSGSENGSSSFDRGSPTSTGFAVTDALHNDSGSEYIYVAIRKGPMKVPTDATKVFGVTSASGEPSSSALTTQSGVLADAVIHAGRLTGGGYGRDWLSRLQGDGRPLTSSSTSAESDLSTFPYWKFDNNSYAYIPAGGYYNNSGGTSETYASYSLKRAPTFFDVVCFTGTGANRTVAHNLAAVPELMISKRRDSAAGWAVYSSSLGPTQYLRLNNDAIQNPGPTFWNDTAPTSSVFTVGSTQSVSGGTYVQYLFATCAGVSKVGSYTGTGTTLQVDCGFSAGARFVMIKRTDSTGAWYFWDTARGIVSGNDPYSLMNSTAAQVTSTDYIDTYSAGFELSSTAPAALNASGGTYIFLAIA